MNEATPDDLRSLAFRAATAPCAGHNPNESNEGRRMGQPSRIRRAMDTRSRLVNYHPPTIHVQNAVIKYTEWEKRTFV